MTADEFREILDRFLGSLKATERWAAMRCDEIPNCFDDLDQVWRDLNRECALMKDAERRPAPPEYARLDETSAGYAELPDEG